LFWNASKQQNTPVYPKKSSDNKLKKTVFTCGNTQFPGCFFFFPMPQKAEVVSHPVRAHGKMESTTFFRSHTECTGKKQ